MKNKWCIYILECLDGTYYTGVTNNVDNRMKMHAQGNGSKYVYQKGFGKLLFVKPCDSKSDAFKFEYEVKQLPRSQKLDWFNN